MLYSLFLWQKKNYFRIMSISILHVPTWGSSSLTLMFGPGPPPFPSPNNCSNACENCFQGIIPLVENWERKVTTRIRKPSWSPVGYSPSVLGTFFPHLYFSKYLQCSNLFTTCLCLPFWALETDRALVFLVFLALVLGTESVLSNYLAVPRE